MSQPPFCFPLLIIQNKEMSNHKKESIENDNTTTKEKTNKKALTSNCTDHIIQL